MPGKRRRADQMELLNRPQLQQRILSIPAQRDRALACFIYLTGARISEIVGSKDKKFYKTNVVEGKKIKVIDSVFDVPPLKKEAVEVLEEDDLILVHNVPCLKRKSKLPRRTIPIVISQEVAFVEEFLVYYYGLAENSPLFSMSRVHAWRLMNRYLGIFNHFLIHERCTHLVTYKNFTDMDLMKYRGWSNTNPARFYTHLNYGDIANKMR